MDKLGGKRAVVVGDSVWDFEAAGRAGLPGYAIRTGGFSPEELCRSAAREVVDSVTELTDAVDRTVLAGAA